MPPRFSLKGLNRQHVLSALADLDSGVAHSFGPPTGYELLHEGKRYPPKAVVGLAAKHLDGRILTPKDFSAGERAGQANNILRRLDFSVLPKAASPHSNPYITSRRFKLPTDASVMASRQWFNMWQSQLWPYKELQVGDTLYWYEKGQKALVWKSQIKRVDRFRYASKSEARRKLKDFFGVDVSTDPYFIEANERGYCVAYEITQVQQVHIAKPNNVRLPQLGWLSSDEEDGANWIGSLTSSTAQELADVSSEVEESGYFSPTSLEDEPKKKLREVVERRGQPGFRQDLLRAYGSMCAVTGCDAIDALEAAHIVAYCGPQSNDIRNGLLLRADIHTLFDLHLIGVDPNTMTVVLAKRLRGTVYEELHERKLRPPISSKWQPNQEALAQRWSKFKDSQIA